MDKRKTFVTRVTFEQIPVELAKKIAQLEIQRATAGFASCAICGDPVELEKCKTNEFGKAVHQNCYVNSLKQPATRAVPSLAK
jgi:hypothetical protein